MYFVDDDFNLNVTASSTVHELKIAIQKETGVVPSGQDLYFFGLPLTDEDTKITDYLGVSNTFNLVLNDEDADKGLFGRKTQFSCDKDVFLLTGGILDFKSIPVKANTDKRIKLKSKKFGVAQDIKGELGQRVFKVKIYNAEKKGSISLITENGDNKVYLFSDRDAQTELESYETQTYEEKLIKKGGPLEHATKFLSWLKALVKIIAAPENSD